MVVISSHAANRFRERVRPAFTLSQARREMQRLATAGEIVSERPEWAGIAPGMHDGYLLLGPDVCLPLKRTRKGMVAVTCLTAGTLPDWVRDRRNRNRRKRASEARMRRAGNRHGETDLEVA